MKTKAVRLHEDTIEMLGAHAKELGTDMSGVMRLAIDKAIIKEAATNPRFAVIAQRTAQAVFEAQIDEMTTHYGQEIVGQLILPPQPDKLK